MTTPSCNAGSPRADGEHLKNTILAGLANYIDAGSIVAGAVALTLWAEFYHLTPRFVGLIGAFSANAISAGVGALLGGWLCDRFGRKKIYQYDMLFYAFGMLWLVFATEPWMIVVGFVLVGLAVGADIPASWSLIAEMAPQGQRGRHSGVAQLLWGLGPTVVLLMFLLLAPLGMLGARIVFAHLVVLAIALTLLRSRMRESHIWTMAKHTEQESGNQHAAQTARLPKFTRQHLRSMAFLISMYGIWNLWAGTFGFFLPYILRTVGGEGQIAVVALQLTCAPLGFASIILIFMRFSDRVSQRLLLGISASIQIFGMLLLAVFPLTRPVVILSLSLFAIGTGFGAQAFYQLWSAELFPTLLRGTAQGITFAVVRIGLGFWSFFVPLLAASEFTTLAWVLTAFLIVSGIIGVIWAPQNEGKSLEQIEAERNCNPSHACAEIATIPHNRQSLPKQTLS